MVDLDLTSTPIGYPGVTPSHFVEQSPTRGTSIELASLALEAVGPFLATARQTIAPEQYSFNLDVGVHDSPTRQPMGLIGGIDISIPQVKRPPARTFGGAGAFGAETFEDGFTAIALVAGAVIVLALVGGGIYASYQISKVGEFVSEMLRPGMALGEAVVEAIIPESEEE